MKELLCIIPARGGSKRLEKKNLALFKGKTLVQHTIKQAQESGLFTSIILSSDDAEILRIGEAEGVEIHRRPASLSTDHVKIIDVVRTLIETRPIADDSIIGILLTTCPLRSVEDIREAYRLFEQHGGKAPVVSVKKNENPIQLSWKMSGGLLEPVFPDEYFRSTRKQDHFETYCYNDAIIFDSAAGFRAPSRNLFGDRPVPYVMPWERSILIDYAFQLKMAQLLGQEE